jgi:hypothetical protein
VGKGVVVVLVAGEAAAGVARGVAVLALMRGNKRSHPGVVLSTFSPLPPLNMSPEIASSCLCLLPTLSSFICVSLHEKVMPRPRIMKTLVMGFASTHHFDGALITTVDALKASIISWGTSIWLTV